MKFYCHTFYILNYYFAYDYITHILISVDLNTYNEIVSFKNSYVGKHLKEDELLSPKFMLYKKCNLFFHDEKDETFNDNKEDINLKTAYISFPTAHKCNLRCSYCFANHGDNYNGDKILMSPKVLDDILKFVYYKQFPMCTRYRLDFVSGGEPLINFSIIEKAVQIATELNKRNGKILDIFLCTNGTINNAEIWEYINAHNINIGISIDGSKNIHNITRKIRER